MKLLLKKKKKKKDNIKITEDKKDDKNTDLKIEKDYVELAKKNATKIKDAKPLPIFTLAYLQNIIELLGPTLEINQINELLKTSNSIFNKRLNEGEKKKVSTKANIKVGKINDRNDKIGEYGDIEDIKLLQKKKFRGKKNYEPKKKKKKKRKKKKKKKRKKII